MTTASAADNTSCNPPPAKQYLSRTELWALCTPAEKDFLTELNRTFSCKLVRAWRTPNP